MGETSTEGAAKQVGTPDTSALPSGDVAPTTSTRKSFVYRLYPNKQQQRLLHRQLEECRWLWNTLLAERKQAWDERQETVDYYRQKQELPDLKVGERPTLNEVHSQVLQDVVLRLKKAFEAFFRRLKTGDEPETSQAIPAFAALAATTR